MQQLSDTYRPDTMVLMTTNQCNSKCRHCGVGATASNDWHISREVGLNNIQKAKDSNIIRMVSMYGGEPFLRYSQLTKELIEVTLNLGMMVNVDTNGYWGRDKEKAKSIMDHLQLTADKNQQQAMLSVSVDKYHQEHIPIDSVINIVRLYLQRNYQNLILYLATQKDEESFYIFNIMLNSLKAEGNDFDIDLQNGVIIPKFGKMFGFSVREVLNNAGRAKNLNVEKISPQEALLCDLGEIIFITPDEKAFVDVDQFSEGLGNGVSIKGKSLNEILPEVQKEIEKVIGKKLKYIRNVY